MRRLRRGSACVAAALILASCTGGADEAENPLLDVEDTAVGACFTVDSIVDERVTTLPFVASCQVPHTHEIYAVVKSDADVYPGFDLLEEAAQRDCLLEFEDYVGISAFDSTLFYSWIVPSLSSWNSEDDREILCVAGDRLGARLCKSISIDVGGTGTVVDPRCPTSSVTTVVSAPSSSVAEE